MFQNKHFAFLLLFFNKKKDLELNQGLCENAYLLLNSWQIPTFFGR